MKFLLVEDEVKLAMSLKRGLEQNKYAVDVVHDGQEAMEQIEICNDEYDLIILDIMLPSKNGIEICKEAREQQITTPIILLTARDSLSDKVQGLDSGADDYIVKPVEFAELLARVRSILRRPKTACLTKIISGGLVLDPAGREVYLDGKNVNLTSKEFAILEYLMRNAGIVLNREQILSHVWDQSFDSFSNVVDVHIASLKKKIDNRKDDKYIETVRGTGYRFKK